MQFIDQLEQAAQQGVVNLHRLLLNVGKLSSGVHAFFEGKTDDSFYGCAIRKHLKTGTKYATYHCGGKRKVHEARSEITGRTPKGHVAIFFTDRDLDHIVPVHYENFDDTYVTDFYSIENHLVSDAMLESIWGELFRQESSPAMLTPVLERFHAGLQSFSSTLRHVMAWIIIHRRAGAKIHIDDQINMGDIFEITPSLDLVLKVDPASIFDLLDAKVGCTTTTEQRSHAGKIIAIFDQQPHKEYVRGRFELWYLIEFSKTLKKWAETKGRQIKPKIELGMANALDILGPRAQTPTSLLKFLETNLKPIIASTSTQETPDREFKP